MDKARQYLGLGRKSGLLVTGEDNCGCTVGAGKAKLLLLASEKYVALGLNETQAAAISCTLLFLMLGAAVALFVVSGIRGKRFAFMQEEPIDTLYGVDGMVRERM